LIAHPINLAVIIVSWRNEEDTLRSAAAVRDWNSLKPKLIVVDNESTEGSRKALASTLDVRDLISSEINLGYGGGNCDSLITCRRPRLPLLAQSGPNRHRYD
jgi:GT2 family glycosyltransferase